MPYMLLTSQALPLETKRQLAKAMTEATLQALNLPPEHRFRTTVHFDPTDPEDIATGGVLWADGTEPDYFLNFTDYGLTPEKEAALVRALVPAMMQALGLEGRDAFKINIKFNAYDPNEFAIGGRFLPELWQQRGGQAPSGPHPDANPPR